MQEPTDISQLCSLLGMVTYYREMWPQHSPILTPLTELLGTKTYIWTDKQSAAFKQMKAVLA